MSEVQEVSALFGPDQALIGILTLPAAGVAQSPVAFLMLNAGAIYRVGPHRINVKLARRLSQMGFTSLRFDLSGLGDSRGSTERAHYRDQAIQDMRAAMDHVQSSTGIERFIVFGICSGAINGYELAMADDRVVGLTLLDGFMFPSTWTRWQRRWHRLRAVPVNPAMFERTWRWLKRKASDAGRPAGMFATDALALTAPKFEAGMNALIARGVSTYLIYSATLQLVDPGRAQLDAFGKGSFVDKLKYEFLAEVDHTVTSLAAQRKLIDAVCRWVGEDFKVQTTSDPRDR